jgi:hypothetical protein
MTVSQLIRDLRKLKSVKPRPDWVLDTKKQILGELEQEKSLGFLLFLRLASASLLALLLVFGLFGFSQKSVPGEYLYYFKKVAERGQIILSPDVDKPKVNLELANKRLEELNKIVENNEVKKLAPAIDEFQANMSRAAKDLTKIKQIDKDIVIQTQKLIENKEKVEKVLATKIEVQEYDNALSQLVEREIASLEEKSLTEQEQLIFEELKADFNEGNYSEALVKVLDLSQSDGI